MPRLHHGLLALVVCACTEPSPPGADQTPAAAIAVPTLAEQLTAATQTCNPVPGTQLFKTDAGATKATVQLCQLDGAIWWRADADIDCDGAPDSRCAHDPWRQPETSAKGSDAAFLNPAQVPFLVVPMASNGFVPKTHAIKTGWSGYGSAGIVLYNGRLVYAPYGDAGPRGIIGELSYAAAVALGIDPDPVRGGVAKGVTYIVFTGSEAHVRPIEDPSAAQEVGERLARRLVARP